MLFWQDERWIIVVYLCTVQAICITKVKNHPAGCRFFFLY
jgi:hypothetical protein